MSFLGGIKDTYSNLFRNIFSNNTFYGVLIICFLDIAQFGKASDLGSEDWEFDSPYLDQ